MNDKPNHTQFRMPSVGAPSPSPSGMSRLTPWLRALLTGSAYLGAGLYLAQIALPYDFRPSVVFGRAAGDTVSGETENMRAMRLDYERRLTTIQQETIAKNQADLAVVQKSLEERTQGVAGLSTAATIFDLACEAGRAVASGSDPRGPWFGAAATVANAACGKSEPLRQIVTASQLDAVHTASAARGMVMPDRPGLAPDAATHPAAPVQAAPPHRDRTLSEQAQLRAYANRLSDAVRIGFIAGIDTVHYGLTPEWYDRVAAFQAAHPDLVLAEPDPILVTLAPAPVRVPVHVVDVPRGAAPPVKAPGDHWTVIQQGQLRIYTYRLPVDVLDHLAAGLDVGHGYPEAWYDRVAAYQAAHRG